MLKSLDLFGFKSFADRTRFDFALGITVVVGPNGSGKSNVVDSIKWILGDQSPKSLRGKEMTDVIFNGSTGRKPSAFAEATLTFDNRTRFLPVDTEEVTIGRRLWRNGDSEYLINGAVSRLKDIKDVFSGTGAATSAYSIIEQGRVDQILHSNPAARRLVFEEAAGISKFKTRKVDALKKIERVQQNLLRLTDIVQQLESQLNSTRSHAAKATKYREVSEELKRAWLGLVADDHKYFSAELQRINARLGTSQGELDTLSAQQSQIEQRLASFDQELNGVEDKLREAEREASTNREAIVAQEVAVHHTTDRLRELDADLERLNRQRGSTEQRLKDAAAELATTEQELATFEDTYTAQQSALQQHDERISATVESLAELRRQLEQHHKKRTELAKQGTEINQRMAFFQAQIESLQQSRKLHEERRDSLLGEIDAGKMELSRRQAAVNEVLSRSSAISESVQSVRSKQKKLLKEQEATQQKLSELREKRSGTQARLHVLEDLEQRQEGVAIGVKEILARARSTDMSPWNLIRGSVADLLDVDLDNAALLEVALGDRAQLIVIDEFEPLIDYLNRGGTRIDGRVGFIRTSHHLQTASTIDLHADPDVINRADDLIASTSPFRDLASRLLSTTWIVTSLDAAFRLTGEHQAGCRFVTLQGELLDADGTLHAGSLRGESAILSRKSELRRLKNDIIRLDQSVESSERQLMALSDQLSAIEGELTSVASARDQVNEKLTQARSEFDVQQQAVERLERDRAAQEAQLADDAKQAGECEIGLQRCVADLMQLDESQQQATAAIAELEQQTKELDDARQTLVQQHTEEKLKLAQREERRANLTKSVQRLRNETHSQSEQAEEAARRFQELTAQRQLSQAALESASQQLSELAIVAERVQKHVYALTHEKLQMRTVRAELSEEENRIRQSRRAIADKQHEDELRAREIQHQLTTCGQRIEEEYGLTLAQVIDSGASAFHDYLKSKGLVDTASPDVAAEPDAVLTDDEPLAQSDELITDEVPGDAVTEPDETGSLSFENAQGTVRFVDVRAEIEEEVNRLRRKLKSMGSVNIDALKEIEELENKYQHFHAQLMDLTEAKNTLEEIIKKVNAESKRLFLESYESIRKEFRELFRKLFGGGDGEVILEDPDDVLDCGIDIVARPPGKELRSISLLSGGEKTLTAVALLLAIFKSRPSPFCILDEVDAALDDANVERYASVVREFRDTTQFIMISHRKRTMVVADVIYGVTMEQSGVSKRMSVRFEDVGENGEFKAPPGSQAA